MKPTSRPIDITNQKFGVRGLSADGDVAPQDHHRRHHAGHQQVIDSNSDMNVPFKAAP